MGDSSNKSSQRKPVPAIRSLLRQAPLNIENMPSRVKGSNVKVLPPKFGSSGPMSMEAVGYGGSANGCMPPTGCYMPAPMCSPYPVPMCTPCPYPCPPQQMCYPPQCPPAFCCPQPYYSQFPCMPPPKCCPPPPCPPPPCCKTEADTCNPYANQNESQCCGAGKTLVCMPKGQRPGQIPGKSGAGNSPSMDQPASYNNCNFYVHELPKGMKSMMGRATATSEDHQEDNYDDDPRATDPNMKNIPAGDGKVFPPPVDRTWGNDDVPITGSPKRKDSDGGKRGNTTNIYIGDDDEGQMEKGRGGGATRNVNGANRNGQHLCKPVGPPVRKDMNGNQMIYGNRNTAGNHPLHTPDNRTTTGNRTTIGTRTTDTRQTGNGYEDEFCDEGDYGKSTARSDPMDTRQRNDLRFGKQTLRQKPPYGPCEPITDGTHTAETFGGKTTAGYTSDAYGPKGKNGPGGRKGYKPNVNVHIKGQPGQAGTGGPERGGPQFMPQNRGMTSDDGNDDQDDDGRGPNGRGVRKKGGFAGGPARDAPSADYCIAQDHRKPYSPVTWKRKHPCCMPLKSRKLKTLCQKCHQRYAPKDTGVDEHCGLPMPSPAQNSRGGARALNKPGTALTVKHPIIAKAVVEKCVPTRDQEVRITQERFNANTTGMQTNYHNTKIAMNLNNRAYPAQHNTFFAQQVLIEPTNRPINLDFNKHPLSIPRSPNPAPGPGVTPFSSPQYKVASSVTSLTGAQQSQTKKSDDSSESGSCSDSDSYSTSSSSEDHDVNTSAHEGKPGIGIQSSEKTMTGIHVAQDSVVHLLNPRSLDSSPSYEIANPLHHQVNASMNRGTQRNFIANIVSVPEFRLPSELFQRYQPFPTIRSRSANHIHEMRKSPPFAAGNTKIIANYMTIAANANPRINVRSQDNDSQHHNAYQMPTNNQPFQFGANQAYQISTNQTYQMPNNQGYQIATKTDYQMPLYEPYPRQFPISVQNPACSTTTTREIVPSHSEIQRIVITKDPNKHTQNVQVVKRHVPHQSIMGHTRHPNQENTCQTTQQVPPCPVQQAQQCTFTAPQCTLPQPQCPVPQPPCQISIQPQCPVSIQAQHSLSIQPQCPLNIDPQPHHIIGSKIETVVRQDKSGSHVRIAINQAPVQADCQPRHPPPSYAPLPRCGTPPHGLFHPSSLFNSTIPPSTCAPALYSVLDTNHQIAASRPPPTICAQTSRGIYSTSSMYLPNVSHKQAEIDWKNTNSVATTIQGIYGDPIRPPYGYRETVRIPHPTTSYTINSYEQPNFGIQPYRTQTRTHVTFNPGAGMGRVPECVHHTPTAPKIPPAYTGCPPAYRSLPKLNGDLCQTELENSHCPNPPTHINVMQKSYQPHGYQPPIPVYRTTTQTQMQIIERPHQPAEVRVIKTPVTVVDDRYRPDDNAGNHSNHGGRGRGRGRSPGVKTNGPPPRSAVQRQAPNSNGGYYQDTERMTGPGKNSCGASPCGPTKGPCYPLRPCRSPRLITCKGQKPIFSAFPPACPIRETLASILSKKPPTNCKYHEKDKPLFYDYCMPSMQFQDPMHQTIKYIDHCGKGSSNQKAQESQTEEPSNRKGQEAGPSTKQKGRLGRGVKRRLN